jgi:hypothetical protein
MDGNLTADERGSGLSRLKKLKRSGVALRDLNEREQTVFDADVGWRKANIDKLSTVNWLSLGSGSSMIFDLE